MRREHHQALEKFEQLLEIMDELRAKCPWDKSQTIESLRHLTIEETYELSDAILSHDAEGIRGELGDLMMHLVFYAKIASEKGYFNIAEVLEGINQKLINRHPHIFGDVVVTSAQEVANNWEKIKLKKEGKNSVLEGVPPSLPPLMKAYRMQEKARGIGFDWENASQVWEKVLEEMRELQHEVNEGSPKERLEEEFGDLLFSLVNYARFIGVNPEDALENTNRKFISRFQSMEDTVNSNGQNFDQLTLHQMDKLWEEAKKSEKKRGK